VLVLEISLIAANLRAAVTVVGPLLGTISRHYGLSGAEAGVLTALPVLGFAAFSPYALRLSRRAGMDGALLLAMLVLAGGIVLRSLPSVAALFAGSVVLASAIAVGNVLLPALVKRHFPKRQSSVTGLYATAMGLIAAIASGVAVPLADIAPGGWRTALGAWAGLALIACVLWIPRLRRTAVTSAPAPPAPVPWRSPVAWKVTAFMGLQSLGFYAMIGWLPKLLESHRVSAHAAGWELFAYQIAALCASLLLPVLISRRADHRLMTGVSALCAAISYAGLAAFPEVSLLWALGAGGAAGASVVLALSFMGLRVGTAEQAAALSAMAQFFGYLLAATGPFLFGVLHDVSGSWVPPLMMLVVTAAALLAVGLGASHPLARAE
jgi:CP family cyanate transporter-like MFS transporter